MPNIETFYYQGTTYTWLQEPQNLYEARHISIRDAVLVIENGTIETQPFYDPSRYKHIGLSPAGIITVITDHTLTRIITAWHSSMTEVKEWLAQQ